MISLIIFCFAVIGMTNILVDGSIFGEGGLIPIRPWLEKKLPLKFPKYGPKIYEMVECHQCMGTWCGFFCGLTLISYNPFIIFACGCAGSCLAQTHYLIVELILSKTDFTINIPNGE